MMRGKRVILLILSLVAGLLIFATCGTDGPNSSSWTLVVNQSVREFDNGFAVSVGSARSGRLNRTYVLTEENISEIIVRSENEEGQITLVISQDGAEDTEVVFDLSNRFSRGIDLGFNGLSPGRIRFSLRYQDIRNAETTISWSN